MNTKLFVFLALALSAALCGCRTAGPVTNGVQMSLSVSGSGKPADVMLEVAFHNAGDKDVCLNLGKMLANGNVMFPNKISLALRDSSGKRQELHFIDRRFASISGRLDDYVVPLRAGSTATIQLSLDQFMPSDGGNELKLRPGHYAVTATYQGSGAETSNLDMTGMKLMNFWKGKLVSNAVYATVK